MLSTDEVAVKAAIMLGTEHWWALPAELHVRLLHVLTDDAIQSNAMRLEMSARLDALTNLAVRLTELKPSDFLRQAKG